MKALKKIAFDCKKATFLIEKKSLDGISMREHFELRYHLTGCSVCRLFQQQSILIDRIFKKHQFEEEQKLDHDFKEQLTKLIDAQIDSKS